jgi:hypothetical protein
VYDQSFQIDINVKTTTARIAADVGGIACPPAQLAANSALLFGIGIQPG